jgi:hypothetical protein
MSDLGERPKERGASHDSHVIDLAETFPAQGERYHLIQWGASFLSCNDEDAVVRAGSLALEYFELVRRQNKRLYRRVSTWQARLVALALLTAACRARARQMIESDGHVKH